MNARPKVAAIVAALEPKFGIGYQGKLPWRLRKEMKFFKDVTTQARSGAVNAVVMGRRTWELIPAKFRPLGNRVNVVLSRSHKNTIDEGVFYFDSFDSVMKHFHTMSYKVGQQDIDKVYVIGGAQLYSMCMQEKKLDYLLLTRIQYKGDEAETPAMDTFLEFEPSQWNQLSKQKLREFVHVEINEDAEREGDYQFEYTMWEAR